MLAPPNAGVLAPKAPVAVAPMAGELCAKEKAGVEVAPNAGVDAVLPKAVAGVEPPNREPPVAPKAGAEKPKPPLAAALDAAPKLLPKVLVAPKAGALAAAAPKAGVLAAAPKAGALAPKPPPTPAIGNPAWVLQPDSPNATPHSNTILAAGRLLLQHGGRDRRVRIIPIEVLPKGAVEVLPNSPPPVLDAGAPKAGCDAPNAGAVEPKAPPKAGEDCCACCRRKH